MNQRCTEEEIVQDATSRPHDDKHALRVWVAEARRARTSEEAALDALEQILLMFPAANEMKSTTGQMVLHALKLGGRRK